LKFPYFKKEEIKNLVLILDDDRKSLVSMRSLALETGFTVFSTSKIKKAWKAYELYKPKVLIIENFLNGSLNGLEFIENAKNLERDLKVLLVTKDSTEKTAIRALKLGINDYFIKPFDNKELIFKLKQIKLDFEFEFKVQNSLSCLSNREKEVFDLTLKGMKMKEASMNLFLTINTVKAHLKSIYKKLGVKSKTEMILKYK